MSPERISVAYIVDSLDGIGGAERQMVELIGHLDRTLIRARVLSCRPGNYFADQLEEAGVPVVIVPKAGKLDLSPAGRLATWLRSGEVDLIHAYLYTPSFYAVLARVLTGRGKVVASERSTLFGRRSLAHLYMPWTYRHADLTIANSAVARADLLKRLRLDPNRVLFIPNGLDLSRFCPVPDLERSALRRRFGWQQEERVLLVVGSYKPDKNPLGLLDALKDLDLQRLHLRFCWVGETIPLAHFESVKKHLASMSLGSAFQVVGRRRDVVDFYRASDALVLNSVREGTPNVVLEALACELPVLATDVSDVRTYVVPGVTGWLIPPDDVTALRQALVELAQTDATKLRSLGSRGRRHLAQLRMDSASLARRHEEVYANLVNASRPRSASPAAAPGSSGNGI
jgi:glycosyltransferase involved in cell wall biosynthesis